MSIRTSWRATLAAGLLCALLATPVCAEKRTQHTSTAGEMVSTPLPLTYVICRTSLVVRDGRPMLEVVGRPPLIGSPLPESRTYYRLPPTFTAVNGHICQAGLQPNGEPLPIAAYDVDHPTEPAWLAHWAMVASNSIYAAVVVFHPDVAALKKFGSERAFRPFPVKRRS